VDANCGFRSINDVCSKNIENLEYRSHVPNRTLRVQVVTNKSQGLKVS